MAIRMPERRKSMVVSAVQLRYFSRKPRSRNRSAAGWAAASSRNDANEMSVMAYSY
ncbi:MAG: hypothetical protein BWY77_01571 [bacterium ADurb.Bin431]|nr:MAG: hypothetical protein BWY77_01571 [bacterium ADurb.Bin431]